MDIKYSGWGIQNIEGKFLMSDYDDGYYYVHPTDANFLFHSKKHAEDCLTFIKEKFESLDTEKAEEIYMIPGEKYDPNMQIVAFEISIKSI